MRRYDSNRRHALTVALALLAVLATPRSVAAGSFVTSHVADTDPAGAALLLGEPLDDPSRFPEAEASFYHVPGSALTPVDSALAMVYDFMGCIHASAGASVLLNAPLEIPDGSRIILLRLYYDDTSESALDGWITRYSELGTGFQDLIHVSSIGSGGHGSNFGNLDHVVDTYNWSYVLNVRLNVATSALQVCGLRVMYYSPIVFRDGFESGDMSMWSAASP